MFYAVGWIALITATVLFSLGTFFWALRNGQFDDQERARFIPLADLPPPEQSPAVRRRPLEICVLSICALAVGAALAICFLLGVRSI